MTGASAALQFVSLLGVMMWIQPLVTPLLAALVVPFLVFRWHIAKVRFAIHRSKTTKRRRTRYYSGLLTRLNAIPTVRLYNLGPLMLGRFVEMMKHLIALQRGLYTKHAIGRAVVAVAFALAFFLAAAWVTSQTLTGVLTLGMLVTYLASAIRFRRCTASLVTSVSGLMEKALYVRDLYEFLAVPVNITDSKGLVLSEVRGEIELRGVTFYYPATDRPALRNVSLHVKPGETVALVGTNGAGKTTLAKLAVRLYDATEGTVLIDGHDIRSLAIRSLHDRVAYVSQNLVRFEATVLENIAFGQWEKLLENPEEVQKIVRQAGIEDLVAGTPEGLRTQLGRKFGTYDLSGGQWQQLALARALARDASILILDEPTSNLDVQSEYEIFRKLSRLARDRTTLLISHRFSTVRMADRILVLEEGELVEEGTHDELLRRGGVYASLYRIHAAHLDGGHAEAAATP